MTSVWWSLLGGLTAFAAVVAFSPFSVLPAIALVVHSERPKSTGVAFVAGWLVGKGSITALFIQVPGLLDGLDRGPQAWTAWARIVAGALLVVAAIGYWVKPQKNVSSPQWVTRIKRITPAAAAAAGVALTLVNPKVLFMCAAAGFAIGAAQLSALGAAAALVYFTLVAGSTAVVPIVAYLIWTDRVDRQVERFKDWLQRRQTVITVVLLMLIGIALLYNGIHAL